ncbi:hypothetical protein niasHS_011745 [Heterodera schachtii]|uniref:Uncharacterized protein n=2 Tax=Heterodera TaxID=34509 RepID=A0ABD2I875_HETSC
MKRSPSIQFDHKSADHFPPAPATIAAGESRNSGNRSPHQHPRVTAPFPMNLSTAGFVPQASASAAGVPPGRLYPTNAPPGTVAVQSPPDSHFLTLRESLENPPLPPIDQQPFANQSQQQQQQPLPFPTIAPPPYYDHFAGPANGAGGIGVRYLVHGPPQTHEVHSVHAVPSGNAGAAGGETVFYYVSSSSSAANFHRRPLPRLFSPHPRRLSFTSMAIFTVIAIIIMFFSFKMHSKFSQQFQQRHNAHDNSLALPKQNNGEKQ